MSLLGEFFDLTAQQYLALAEATGYEWVKRTSPRQFSHLGEAAQRREETPALERDI